MKKEDASAMIMVRSGGFELLEEASINLFVEGGRMQGNHVRLGWYNFN